MSSINPAFDKFPREEAIIGRIILAFGELEYKLVAAAAIANGEWHSIMRALYRLRATSQRRDAADAMIRPVALFKGFDDDYSAAIGAFNFCHTIRNTFAHCNWASDNAAALFYTDIEGSVKAASYAPFDWKHVDEPLLLALEQFYANARDLMFYLHDVLHLAKGHSNHLPNPKPRSLLRPPLHNPPEQHVPPWTLEGMPERLIRQAREEKEAARLAAQNQPLRRVRCLRNDCAGLS